MFKIKAKLVCLWMKKITAQCFSIGYAMFYYSYFTRAMVKLMVINLTDFIHFLRTYKHSFT